MTESYELELGRARQVLVDERRRDLRLRKLSRKR
jgi:hypothetical protein